MTIFIISNPEITLQSSYRQHNTLNMRSFLEMLEQHTMLQINLLE